MSTATAFKLRDYQQQLVSDIYSEWDSHRRVMAQLPTGGGKTVVFASITQEFTCRNIPVLVRHTGKN